MSDTPDPAKHWYHIIDGNERLRNYDMRTDAAYKMMLDLLWRLNVID